MGGTEEEVKHEEEVEVDKKDKKEKKEKKKKNPEDKKDPVILKQKLEKLDSKIQPLVAKREEILKLLNELETNPTQPPAASS
ncbi:unnamed protein product [Lathyrus oleraceus]